MFATWTTGIGQELVTEAQFLAAWHAREVQGWPDQSLVWWTNSDGGCVPLNDDCVSRQRFGDRIPVFDESEKQQGMDALQQRVGLGVDLWPDHKNISQ